MSHVIARLTTIPALMLGSAWLVGRYRATGVGISVLLGWGILYFVYHAWPAPPEVWDEDREEIHYTTPILMVLWCLLVWGVVSLLSSFKKREHRHEKV